LVEGLIWAFSLVLPRSGLPQQLDPTSAVISRTAGSP
jgi:hypothetical protein